MINKKRKLKKKKKKPNWLIIKLRI